MKHSSKEKEFEKRLRDIEPDIIGKARSFRIPGMDIKDVAQELRIQLWRKFHLFNPQKASFRTWTIRVIRNKLIDLHRRASTKKRGGVEIIYFSELQEMFNKNRNEEEVYASDKGKAAQEIIDHIDNQKDNQTVLNAIEELPEIQKKVVKLRFYKQLSFKEIARGLGVDERIIQESWKEAKKELKIKLKNFK